MTNKFLILGGVVSVISGLLWINGKLDEPYVFLIASLVTLLGSVFSKNKKIMNKNSQRNFNQLNDDGEITNKDSNDNINIIN